MSNFTR